MAKHTCKPCSLRDRQCWEEAFQEESVSGQLRMLVVSRRAREGGLYLVSEYVDVVAHVPRGGSSILSILPILKFYFTLHVGFLDHLHL